MDTNKKILSNIRSLSIAGDGNQSKAATNMGISVSHMSDVMNGKKPLTLKFLEKVSTYYGLSIDALTYEDYSNPIIPDPNLLSKSIHSLLPTYCPESAKQIPLFVEAYHCQNILLDAEKDRKILSSEYAVKLVNTAYDNYTCVLSQEEAPDEAIINLLALYFHRLMYLRFIENIINLTNNFPEDKGKEKPLQIRKIEENNPAIKPIFEEIWNNIELRKTKPLSEFIQDKEFMYEISECITFMKHSSKWWELADYYIALQYVLGAVNNNLSALHNHEFGIDLMSYHSKLGNPYADKYFSIILPEE